MTCLTLLAASSTLAQDGRWFRVELLVFSHESKQTAEQWDPAPTLVYPGAGRFLVDPRRIRPGRGCLSIVLAGGTVRSAAAAVGAGNNSGAR